MKFLCLTMLCALTGCGTSFLSDRGSNPVITDYQVSRPFHPIQLGVISTTAGRRSIFIKYSPNGELDQICAEPPPDAVDSFANALSAAAKASAQSGAAGELSLSKSFQVTSGLGLYRSQGLQLIRDRSSSLCMDVMEGRITSDQYFAEMDKVTSEGIALVQAEIPVMLAAANRPYMIVTTTPISTTVTTPTPAPAGGAPAPVAPKKKGAAAGGQ